MYELAVAFPDGVVSVKEVAGRQALSVKYLEQIVVSLKAAGLIRSVRGVNGGYALAKRPDRVRLLDVYEAIEGPLVIVDCVSKRSACRMSGDCPTRCLWAAMNDALQTILATRTLADLAAGDGRRPALCGRAL